MIIDKMKENIKNIAPPSRWYRGLEYHRQRKIRSCDISTKGNNILIKSQVTGSLYNQIYQSDLIINLESLEVVKTRCQCSDYNENKNTTQNPFMCKHLLASALEGVNRIKATMSEEELIILREKIKEEKIEPDKLILDLLGKEKEKVNLDINIKFNYKTHKHKVDFKIGKEKMYILKSPKDFSESRSLKKEINYGKDFIYTPKECYFSKIEEDVASFIDEMAVMNDYMSYVPKQKKDSSIIEGKFINIMDISLKRFLDLLQNKTITFEIDENTYKSKIIREDVPMKFNLNEEGNNLIIDMKDEIPIPLTKKGDVIFYKENLYLPSYKQYNEYRYLYSGLKKDEKITFKKEDSSEVITKIVPKLEEMSENVEIQESIKEKIIKDLEIKFYIDKNKGGGFITPKFIYENQQEKNQNNCYIIKDTKRENQIKNLLNEMNFIEKSKNNFYFDKEEDKFYEFLADGVSKLKEYGEVYYSDKIKYNFKRPNISAGISQNTQSDYLQINFELEDIDKSEYKDILKSFRENKKFYKLNKDVILDLRNNNIKDFFDFLDNISIDVLKEISEDTLNINANKSIYINQMLNKDSLDFVNGKEYVKSIAQKIDSLDSIDIDIPKNLNATLRCYQQEGYTWLKTLEHYGFGGILADEMGLGKTIQTITFLLSNIKAESNKKALIVTPTSLIYNWKDEFENFASELDILIVHGDKSERTQMLKTINEHDIVLTTYSTLRNDFELYKDLEFEYMVIDEAQNIKNPNALSTEVVKNIKAKYKYALTGTPIENNLMELWSIFDFVMPGYLFNSKSFEKKFIKGSKEDFEVLKKMIKPFILRRLKKEVLKELPQKIEKKFFVEMNEGQRKAYKVLIQDINEKRNDKDFRKDKLAMLSYLMKLRQLCLDPGIILDNYNGGSSKVDVCLELIEENIRGGHKILLFSQFTTVLKRLGEKLDTLGINYAYLDGATKSSKRIELVNNFNNSDENQVFLISLKAGGTGLNLTSADIVIHFDPWWNPAIEDQASDRAHRIGQKNVVEVIKLISKGSVEEKILKLQEDKKTLIENVLSGDMKNSSLLSSLSEEDINELFEI